MRYPKLLLSLLILLCACSDSLSQDSTNIEHVIASNAFGEERRVRVFLPERYFIDTTSEYAVTYVLDAQSDKFWNMAKSNIGYLVDNYQVIPMIAIGIVSDNRGAEFNPKNRELHQHIKEEVIPLIDSIYRAGRLRAVIGHSWGGAFVGNTLFGEHHDLFGAYIGISPSLDAIDGRIFRQADSILSKGYSKGKFLFCSSGNVGAREVEYAANVAKMDSLANLHPQRGFSWAKATIEGTDHWSCVIPSMNQGLVLMSRNYFPDQKVLEDFASISPKKVKKKAEHFIDEKEKLFGFHHSPSAGYLKFVADDFREMEQYEVAISLYSWSLEMDSTRIRTLIGLADTYDRMEDERKGKPVFEKVLIMLEEQKESLSDGFYADIKEWAEEKLQSD